ncbi:terpene synthase family protein [Chondromyces crocatus]|uniref:Terpene synthase n=1 Tax=Chondromyces crocatus TaxID=52 RepID=A0A0K1ECM7_CHOCO|nr:hypothetical protein [Chondromyces crocatus]AKT38621.1 uncharacterized protein CMC5_027680 [Chondromyces crocatus]
METNGRPLLSYPFPPALHPLAEPINRATIDWTHRVGIMPTEPAAQRRHEEYGWFGGRIYPTASEEQLDLASCFLAWLFLADDQLDETLLGRETTQVAHLHTRFDSILGGAHARPDDVPLVHALEDILVRLAKLASAPLLERFCRDVSAYFEANRWECENRRRHNVPCVAEYVAMRPFTGAVIPCFDLIYLTNQVDLPERLHAHPLVQATQLAANRVICYSNDILSLGKEIRHGDVNNLVILIQHEQRCSLNDALHRAAALHDAELATYLSLERSLTAFEEPVASHLARLTAGLRSWMRANGDWSERAARYKDD